MLRHAGDRNKQVSGEKEMFTYRIFEYLCQEARCIREEVFVKEQGFRNEFDEIDQTAFHVVFYEDDTPAGVCRCYPGEKEGEYVAGRIAVLKDYRGREMGSRIMATLEEILSARGGRRMILSAQMRARGFYEKNGYTTFGEPYPDEYCPHIHMEKELDNHSALS